MYPPSTLCVAGYLNIILDVDVNDSMTAYHRGKALTEIPSVLTFIMYFSLRRSKVYSDFNEHTCSSFVQMRTSHLNIRMKFARNLVIEKGSTTGINLFQEKSQCMESLTRNTERASSQGVR